MKYALLAAALLVLAALTGCGSPPAESMPPETTLPSFVTSEPTLPETAPPTETALPTETVPLHCPLYIADVSPEDAFLYFQEVCLAAEYVNSGDPSFLQKWEEPIRLQIFGTPTEEDLTTLRGFMEQLNALEGFPGIFETTDPNETNLKFHFCSSQEMASLMGDTLSGMDGAVTFWYLDDKIYDAIICCRTDLDQHLRNSVILEELYNGLGPIQDTTLRPDSIIWQEFSRPQTLTDVDWLILKLLYHPDMLCGMSGAECEAVVRALYY